ncbi:nucleotide sugar dehydrogenase [Guptibacillus hwajinpoensis]|uniref:UDP-N-acetyl-D-glucosamine dehydrogenase n=1 Tax=Guptibacillus hwajinpoensis TaxID=208199 RepID=A0ABU0K015_9BACL|nr:nucleotide sugar dehydrogenase [Alkalihalobacillus hemicentroti]MDQ0482689.1 UDP-N-acetyl-D-glucosamine dehydrogenase [Alkalihalobacillus hemicentroti]
MGVKSNANIEHKKIGIIGLGYVGLPLALLFVKKGFHVTGIDLDGKKIEQLKNGKSYLPDLSNEEIANTISSERLLVADHYDVIPSLDVVIICVPTPLGKSSNPDLSFLTHAAGELKKRLIKGQVVILESSTYPGTTTEVLQPILEQSGFMTGEDYFLGYSPERIDPGNKDYKLCEIPKVVSGVTVNCEDKICELYSQVFDVVEKVSSTQVAEMTKLLENSYRLINISFINELAMLCDRLNIDIWEVIKAAKTKPYGFSDFYPGPGVGGHCIPVDPLYLSWKGRQHGFVNQFIHLANDVNQQMPGYIIEQVHALLRVKGLVLEDATLLICGVSYKKENGDTRESPPIHIMESLKRSGADVHYHDPFVPKLKINEKTYTSNELTADRLKLIDCVIILTDHMNLPIQFIIDHSSLVLDCRNATHGYKGKAKIVRLGGGGK